MPLTPAQVIDQARLDLLTPSQRAMTAIRCLRIPWIERAALEPGAITHHGTGLVPIAGTREAKMVAMLTVAREYPPKSALIALVPSGDKWAAQCWIGRACPFPFADSPEKAD